MKTICYTLLALVLAACAGQPKPPHDPDAYHSLSIEYGPREWWHNTIFYEIWPRSFYDADGDGSGDFKGIIAKLDYLSELGVSGIWLTPVFEAPSYHGYDFVDFYAVEKDYGSMADFEALIAACHQRGIKVILDLVINHISSDHEWFKKSAAREPGYEDFFIWSKTVPEGWGKPWSTEANPSWVWHFNKQRGEYYYGAFDNSQPDVNLQNPQVIAEMNRMAEFWLNKGVDGFRLDAVRYAIEEGPTPAQADTDGTIAYWTQFTQFVKSVKPDALLVGEAWTGLEVIAKYRNQGRGLDSGFDFDFGYVVTGLLNPEASQAADFGTLSTANLSNTREDLWNNLKGRVASAPISFYSPFLTNHDQNRLAATLKNHPVKAKIAASLLWTTPGPLYMYYGEEIGMTQTFTGDDQYRRAIMEWDDAPAAGFSSTGKYWLGEARWFPWMSKFKDWWGKFWAARKGKGHTVAAQAGDPNSLYNHYKRMIALRNAEPALQFPTEMHYYPVDHADVWLLRQSDGERVVWVLVNLNGDGKARFTVPTALRGERFERLSERTLTLGEQWQLAPGEIQIF